MTSSMFRGTHAVEGVATAAESGDPLGVTTRLDLPLALALLALGCTPANPSAQAASDGSLAGESQKAARGPSRAASCGHDESHHVDAEQATEPISVTFDLSPFGPFTASGPPTSWAVPSATVVPSCRTVSTSAPAVAGIFRGGGFLQQFCTYEIGSAHVTSEAELARALAPIDAPRKALAMVAIGRVLAFEPSVTAPPTTRTFRAPRGARATELQPFTFEVVENGYVVRVPIAQSCSRSIVRVPFLVTRAGAICTADEAPITLHAEPGPCVD
jgi:hypothetical protein